MTFGLCVHVQDEFEQAVRQRPALCLRCINSSDVPPEGMGHVRLPHRIQALGQWSLRRVAHSRPDEHRGDYRILQEAHCVWHYSPLPTRHVIRRRLLQCKLLGEAQHHRFQGVRRAVLGSDVQVPRRPIDGLWLVSPLCLFACSALA
jgi:hypothetical protein